MTNLWVDSAICWAPTQQGRDEKEGKHLHRQMLGSLACFLDYVSLLQQMAAQKEYVCSNITKIEGVLLSNITRSC